MGRSRFVEIWFFIALTAIAFATFGCGLIPGLDRKCYERVDKELDVLEQSLDPYLDRSAADSIDRINECADGGDTGYLIIAFEVKDDRASALRGFRGSPWQEPDAPEAAALKEVYGPVSYVRTLDGGRRVVISEGNSAGPSDDLYVEFLEPES